MRSWYSDETPSPGVVPNGSASAGTMFVALYGNLIPHEWRGSVPDQDAYSLFVQRASAMGWSLEHGGLWQMNDAGWDHLRAPRESPLLSWFQVDASAVPVAMPLPVQPFLRCATDVTARVGSLDLKVVQLLLPIEGLLPGARSRRGGVPSMRTMRWFGEAPPDGGMRVDVTVDSGLGSADAVARLATWVRGLDQRVLQPVDCVERGGDEWLPPPFDATFWSGPSAERATFSGTLREWTPDAVGWFAEVVAEGVAQLGGTSPVLVTTSRRPQSE